VLQHRLELEVDGSTQRGGQSLGHIIISTVFRSVNSVTHAGTRPYTVYRCESEQLTFAVCTDTWTTGREDGEENGMGER